MHRDRPDLATNRAHQDRHRVPRGVVVVDVRVRLEADQRVGEPRHARRAVDVGVECRRDRDGRPDHGTQALEQVSFGVLLLGGDRRAVQRQHHRGQAFSVLARRVEDQRPGPLVHRVLDRAARARGPEVDRRNELEALVGCDVAHGCEFGAGVPRRVEDRLALGVVPRAGDVRQRKRACREAVELVLEAADEEDGPI